MRFPVRERAKRAAATARAARHYVIDEGLAVRDTGLMSALCRPASRHFSVSRRGSVPRGAAGRAATVQGYAERNEQSVSNWPEFTHIADYLRCALKREPCLLQRISASSGFTVIASACNRIRPESFDHLPVSNTQSSTQSVARSGIGRTPRARAGGVRSGVHNG